VIVALPSDLIEEIKNTLVAGRYSLFIGAGASIGGLDRRDKALPSSEVLRQRLVDMKGIKASSSLARAYNQLTQGEIDTEITERLSNCKPGPAMLRLPKFVWRRIYSLNIDDSLFQAYGTISGTQTIDCKTHKTAYSDNHDIDVLEAIHIHGWSRKPEDGYVFSLAEYVKTMGANSPWTTVLAHSIATEPFIVAGTSLEEPDLEFFLNGRRTDTVRRDRGPSFLIEPNPDSATRKDCNRHGLILYEGTFEEFLKELDQRFPTRPIPTGASPKLLPSFFINRPTAKELALFAIDFAHITAQQSTDNADLSFYVGHQPTMTDIALERDISRTSTLKIKTFIQEKIQKKDWESNFLLVDDNAGTGKSTTTSRLAYDFAAEGALVFQYKSVSSANLEICSKIFNNLAHPFIIFCDDFADHVSAIAELYRRIHREDFLIVGSERSYRLDYVLQSLAGNSFEKLTLDPFDINESRELIKKMEGHGLTSYRLNQLDALAGDLTSDSIAIAVCRIIQDFKPIEKIIESLLHETDQNRLVRYLGCALASYCYRVGLAYPVMVAAFPDNGLQLQLTYYLFRL
jgi:hypothetical protein